MYIHICAGIVTLCVCPPAVALVKPTAVAESLADVAKVEVVLLITALPDAVATTKDADAAVEDAPTVPLLVPLPIIILSPKAGTLKVVEPSPAP